MALEMLSVIVGFVVGGLAVGIVVETMGRGRTAPRATSKLTTAWRLAELGEPLVVARDVMDLEVPPGATVLASGLVDPQVARDVKVHRVPSVRAEFALDEKEGRALVFLGGARAGTLALLTVDEAMVDRLRTEARTLQDRAGAYVEQHPIHALGGREGAVVETTGVVQDVVPFREGFLIRLADQDDVIGVVVAKDPSGLRDERIQVRGRLVKESGYAQIVADDIRTVR